MHDFISNSQFPLLETIKGRLKQLESMDNPTPFVSGGQRPPPFVSPATHPSWNVVEGGLGGSGKGLGLPAQSSGLAGWQ